MGILDCIQNWLNDKSYSIDEYYRLQEEGLNRMSREVNAKVVAWKDSEEYRSLLSEGYVVKNEVSLPISRVRGTIHTEEIKTLVEMLPGELYKELYE